MNWNELLKVTSLDNIEVELIKPLRNPMFIDDETYTKGELQGFKAGVIGGGHSRYKNGVAHSFDSSKMGWLKKPKVLVAYNCFTYGKSQHTDWVDVDNCIFKLKPKQDD